MIFFYLITVKFIGFLFRLVTFPFRLLVKVLDIAVQAFFRILGEFFRNPEDRGRR